MFKQNSSGRHNINESDYWYALCVRYWNGSDDILTNISTEWTMFERHMP